MTRARRWKTWTAVVLGALIVGMILGYLIVVPRLVREQVRTTLDRAGLPDAKFDLDSAGLWGTTIANLDAGGDGVAQVKSIELDYGPSIVWTRQVEHVQISGAEVVLRLKDGKVDAGVLGKLLTAPPTPTTTTRHSTSAPAADRAPQLIPAIELGPSTLVLEAGKRRLRIPVHGTLKKTLGQPYQVHVISDTKPKPLTIDATITESGQVLDLTATAESVDVEVLSLLLEGLAPASDVVIWGQVGIQLNLAWSGSDGTAKIRLEPQGLNLYKGAKLQVPKGVILVDANFGSTKSPTATATLDVPLLGIGDIWLEHGTLKLAMNDTRGISVEENRWSWLGGTLSSQPFAVAFAQPSVDIVLEAQEIDLKQLLEYFAKDKARGEGKLNGHLAINLGASGVDFGNGRLDTVGGGVVRIGDVAGIDQALAAGHAKKASPEDQLKANAAEALRDFEYERLQADLTKTNEGLAAYVQIVGRGRAGARQAVNYELNLRGLDYLIKLYLGLQALQGAP